MSIVLEGIEYDTPEVMELKAKVKEVADRYAKMRSSAG